jgi:hypothetical protein
MKVVAAAFISLVFGTALFAQWDVNFDFGVRTGVPITKPLAESEALCCFRPRTQQQEPSL